MAMAGSFPDGLRRAVANWKTANGCKLPPVNPWDGVYRLNIPTILGFSPASFTPPADWAPFDYIITGDWVLSADDLPEEPTATLVDFIKVAGKEPPLYLGWGSMAYESGQYMTELAVRALHAIGKRGIVFEGKFIVARTSLSEPQYPNPNPTTSKARAVASSSGSASTSLTPPSPTQPRWRRGRQRTCS